MSRAEVGVSTLEIQPTPDRGRVELNGYPQPSRVHTGTPATRDVSRLPQRFSGDPSGFAGPRGRMGESLPHAVSGFGTCRA